MAFNVKPVLYKGSVYIYFSVRQEAVRIPCGFRAEKLLESGYLGKTSGVSDIDEKNAFIKDKIREVEQGIKDHPHLTAKEYKLYFKKGVLPDNIGGATGKKKQIPFLEAFQKFIDDTEAGKRLTKEGTTIKEATITTYKSTLVNLKSFSQHWLETKGKYLDWDVVDDDFYYDFCRYQWDVLDNYDNTVGLRNRIIRTFLNWSFNTGIIKDKVDISKWKTWTEDINRLVLHTSEIKLINNIPFLPKKLEEARDIFLMGVFTCMRVQNLLKLTQKDLKVIGGEHYIDFTVDKTKQQLLIKLNPIAVQIIKKYEGEYKTLLPTLRYPTFNNRLKSLAKFIKQHFAKMRVLKMKVIKDVDSKWEAGLITRRRFKQGKKVEQQLPIEEAIRSHVMRYSGITNALAMGMTPYEVCAISGHKLDSVEFIKYVNLSNVITQNKAVDLWSKAMA